MPESSFLPHRQPFLYLLTALLGGILIDRFLEPPRPFLLGFFIIFLLLSAIFVFTKKSVSATLCLLFAFLFMGSLLSQSEGQGIAENRLQRLIDSGIIALDEPVEVTGVLAAPPEPAPDAYFLDFQLESVRAMQDAIPASGHLRLLIAPADEQAKQEYEQLGLDYGSKVRVLVRLEEARSYQNPGSPDFNDFLERQGFDAKGVIKSPLLIEPLGRVRVNGLLAALFALRLRLLHSIDNHFAQPVAGTLKAMLLGNRYFLDPQTSERLRESSTFHTLVISGMHIAIIAWALLHLRLTAIPGRRAEESQRYRKPTLWRVLLAFIVLWSYTVMVGLAPPVVRATLMISVGLFAPLFFRQAASINTVALAAFLMLALKPALVADAGFQLSFVAVVAIVTLVIPINEKFRQIGEWRPAPETPQPPLCSSTLKSFCEVLYWNQRAFEREMQKSPITYRLEKSRIAIALNRLRLQPLLRSVILLLLTSTMIQLATMPLMAFYFNRVAPIGILLNVFSGLLTAIIMLGSLTAIITTSISSWMAAEIGSVVSAAHYLLVHAIVPFSKFSLATFRVAHYEGWQKIIYAAYFVPLALLVWMIDNWRPVSSRQKATSTQSQTTSKHNQLTAGNASSIQQKFTPRGRLLSAYCLLLTLPLSLFAVAQPPNRLPRGKLTVYFLDVGQGDSALIVFPQGGTMLIDGGGEPSFDKNKEQAADDHEAGEEDFQQKGFSVGEVVVCRFLWAMGVRHLDYVVATHADTDHMAGLVPVIKNFAVSEVIVGQPLADNMEFARLAMTTTQRRSPMATVQAGMTFDIEGVTVEVLHPSATLQEKSNNTSIVLRLRYGTTSFLFTGDIEKDAEASLLKSGLPLQSDVLKVPHHGSRTSSTAAFLDAVRPQLAVISVGKRSRFHHPHPEIVERYQQRGIRLLQTGRDGMITVQTDGASLSQQTYSRQ